MPDPDGRYTTTERARYDPSPCPFCGRRTLLQQWADARSAGDTQDWWKPSRKSCRNPHCDLNTGKATEV